ncbi:hypothetical protein M218_23080 [Burkholderia pseudomallei MSHR338]|nr:hypothetical protein M218_23080 [Burkholderia pseudomallei MSHR338]
MSSEGRATPAAHAIACEHGMRVASPARSSAARQTAQRESSMPSSAQVHDG